jgi:DNA-binding response OmpR family regulator
LIELTASEFDLLAIFVREPQTALYRDRIVDLTFGRSSSSRWQKRRCIDQPTELQTRDPLSAVFAAE